jgi:histidine kinase/DNA gyrase B/HSP90-like ATPase
LDVSKLEAGLLGAWRKPGHLIDVVQHVLPALERKAEVRGVSLEVAIDEPLPMVYCDGEKLGRVIINLVVNAIKFSGEPGIVRLWAKDDAQAKEVVIGVTDNGPGIDEEYLETIFGRFKQLGTDVRSSTKGFGLGLAIAKELVALNFGTMNVESELGRGSTFSFTVPWAEPVEVATRYLSQIAQRHEKAATVTLVKAQVEEAVGEDLCGEVDAFLSYLLRRNDMLFRLGTREWLFLLLTPEIELDRFLERVETMRLATNRNRPCGPLPPIQCTTDGSWQVSRWRDAIIARVLEHCGLTEASYG